VVSHFPAAEKGDVEVVLRGGTYFLSKPLVLDHTCSGSKDGRRIFRAFEGEQPVISGGRRISGWKLHDAETNIWKADTSELGTTFRQLYVNGVDAVRARYPNQLRRYAQMPALMTTDLDYEKSVICLDAKDVEPVLPFDTELKDLELIIHGVWYHTRLDIDYIALDGDKARLHSTQFDCLNHDPRGKPGQRKYFVPRECFLEGHRALLDAPGEWYHDSAAEKLYYIPKFGEDPNKLTFTVPVTETLVSIGTDADHPTGYIEFHNIDFEYSTWLDPETVGLDFTQGLRRSAPMDGMVEVRHAHNLKFCGNRFRGAGLVGLLVEKAMKRSEVRGNVFELIMGNGLQLGTSYDFEAIDKTEHCVVADNLFYNVGRNYYAAQGIAGASYHRDILIEHNDMSDMPYIGIQLGRWHGFPSTDPEYIAQWGDVGMRRNIVRRNHIYRAMQVVNDGGCIYTFGRQGETTEWEDPGNNLDYRNSYVYENWCHGIDRTWTGILYTDGGPKSLTQSKYILFKDNVLTGPRINIQNKGRDYCPMLNTPMPKDDPRFERIRRSAGLQGESRALRGRLKSLPTASGHVEAENMHLSGVSALNRNGASGNKVVKASAPVFDHLPKEYRPAEVEFIFDGEPGLYTLNVAYAAGKGVTDFRVEIDCDWDRTETADNWKWQVPAADDRVGIQVHTLENVQLSSYDRIMVRLFYKQAGGALLDFVELIPSNIK
jgi:hypothetical protein